MVDNIFCFDEWGASYFFFRGWLDYKTQTYIYIYIHVCVYVCVYFEHPPPILPSPFRIVHIDEQQQQQKRARRGLVLWFSNSNQKWGGKRAHTVSLFFFLPFFLSLSSTKNKYMKSFTYVYKHMHIITTSRKAGGG